MGPYSLTVTVLLVVSLQDVFGVLNSQQLQDIDGIVSQLMRCRDIPGMGVAVVLNGQTVVQKGYGFADVENNVPFTEKTLFAIASVSKQMSATLLALLMNEKGISWKRRIKEILPDFELNSDFLTNITTIRDVMAHRTGIVSSDLTWLLGELDRDDLYRRLKFSSAQYEADFRDVLRYNNVVFSIAAKLSEKLGGKTWETLMEERIFKPLGMTASTFYDKQAPDWTNFAKAYVKYTKSGNWTLRDPRAISSVGAIGPAGSISSTVEDMAKYLKFLVSEGKTEDNRTLVPSKALQGVFYPVMVLPQPWFGGAMSLNSAPFKRSLDSYAKGWMVGWYKGHKILAHGGNLFGHDCFMTYIPEKKSAIYSFVNGPASMPSIKTNILLHSYMVDVALGDTPWLNGSTACSYPQPWGKENDFYYSSPNFNFPRNRALSRPIDEYLGTFGNFALGNVTVIKNEDGQLQMNYGIHGKLVLYPQAEKDKFYVEAKEPMALISEVNSRFSKLRHVKFTDAVNGKLNKVNVAVFNIMSPPIFVRNQKLSDAPMPKSDPCDVSGSPHSPPGSRVLLLLLSFLLHHVYLS